jgi:hypothetical protein
MERQGGLTIFLCRVMPGSQEVIIAVLLSGGRPSVLRIRSMWGTNIIWGRHQALRGLTSGQAVRC